MAPVTAIPATSLLDSVNATLRSAGANAATQSPSATGGVDFANMITQGLDQVQGLQKTSDDLAVQAATGDLTDVHDYMIAATQAQVATEITVALRNKAVEAFSEIMRMQA